MGTLDNIGRIFYGISIAEMGVQIIYCHDFPYFFLPSNHTAIPGITIFAFIFGALFITEGLAVVLSKNAKPVSLVFGVILLLVFLFYHVPYELLVSPNNTHFGDWENAFKELALAGGALAVAGCFTEKNERPVTPLLTKMIPWGSVIFALTIISFSGDHFLYARQAADYVPAWAPAHLFWMYFCGAALLTSGIAIIIRIQARLAAMLLGAMILTWFITLHVPRVVVAAPADRPDEITSAFLALAYCGIAWVVAGNAKKNAGIFKL
ncbi:MAG: hypothetical protein JST19_06250 [Bacteroidetes bacterium]|nr:hypothetical protein [Bacteroidota bacterium]